MIIHFIFFFIKGEYVLIVPPMSFPSTTSGTHTTACQKFKLTRYFKQHSKEILFKISDINLVYSMA